MFKKKNKKDGVQIINFREDQFGTVIELKAEEATHTYAVQADDTKYMLLYRNGEYVGMPRPNGGTVYPFATDPKEQGSKKEKKKFHAAKIVCLSRGAEFKIYWGTALRFDMLCPVTNEAYEVGANGVFYLHIDPSDAARNADKFYKKCLAQRNAEGFNTQEMVKFLNEAFIMQVGAKIQEYFEEKNLPLSTYVGLPPSAILKISGEVCPKMSEVFSVYGLSIEERVSKNSVLQALIVKKSTK